ncbi:MAG TPA: carbonic anhydrase [Patescibacteria group bacterium]|nr:carbonic anhydrase [Patescibacteria group bacterium]
MSQVTALSDQDIKTLNDALDPLVHQLMTIFAAHADKKFERVAYNLVESALKMADRLPPQKKLGALVDGSNKLLPKIQKYVSNDDLAVIVPENLRKPEIADLCDKAGATSLAALLRASFNTVAAPAAVQPQQPVAAPVTAPVKTNTAPVVAAVTPPVATQVSDPETPAAAEIDAEFMATAKGAPGANQTLVDGFQRFRRQFYGDGNDLMTKLVKEGAHSEFFVINCIDSRSGADLVFDGKPGQEYTHSQMAGIVPPFDKNGMEELNATLHYVIDVKKIKHVILMGHSHCGGCAALVDKTDDPYIEPWVDIARDARDRAENKVGTADTDALKRETERQIVVQSLKNLLDYPMVRDAVEAGKITVNGWYFDMANGVLNEYDPESDSFRQLNKIEPPAPISTPQSQTRKEPQQEPVRRRGGMGPR